MNYWKVYFLAYFIQNIQKVNMVGPWDSNVTVKTYGGPCMYLKVWFYIRLSCGIFLRSNNERDVNFCLSLRSSEILPCWNVLILHKCADFKDKDQIEQMQLQLQ